MTTTSETLNRAADLIEERGWVQFNEGWEIADRGPLCLEGAILAAIHFDGSVRPWFAGRGTCPSHDAVCDYLGIDGQFEMPWSWNDEDGRTAAEVIEVLRSAAVIEAAKENAETRAEVSA